MKRLHINLQVQDLNAAIAGYEALFGCRPTLVRDDYARWEIDEPQISLSLTDRGHGKGLDHLGIKFDNMADFRTASARLQAAEEGLREETNTSCCYARSDKQWWTDPTGLSWELYVTHEQLEAFGSPDSAADPTRRRACC